MPIALHSFLILTKQESLCLNFLHLAPCRVPSSIEVPDPDIICRFFLQTFDFGTHLALFGCCGLNDIIKRIIA